MSQLSIYFSKSAGDALSFNNEAQFTTYDVDNDGITEIVQLNTDTEAIGIIRAPIRTWTGSSVDTEEEIGSLWGGMIRTTKT